MTIIARALDALTALGVLLVLVAPLALGIWGHDWLPAIGSYVGVALAGVFIWAVERFVGTRKTPRQPSSED